MLALLISGLAVGAVYAFIAIGYNITHLGTGVINFAHADFVIFGAFLAIFLFQLDWLPSVLVFLLAGIVAAAIGIIEERLAIRPLKDTGAHAELITTLGVSTIFGGAMLLAFGSKPQAVPYAGPVDPIEIAGNFIYPLDLIIIASVTLVAVAIWLIFHKTRLGRASLAQTEDREAATLRGIDVRLLSLLSFALATFVAGMLGPLIGAKTFAIATLPLLLAVKGFVALSVGGVGNIMGGLIGGLALGVIETFAARYVGDQFREVAVFAVFILVLVLRPQGLFGRTAVRVV